MTRCVGRGTLQGQCRGRVALNGQFQTNVRRADSLETLRHNLSSQVRAIALATKMPEVQVAKISGDQLFDGVGGSLIGQVTMASENSLLQTPRAMRAILDHFDVMVGFEDQDVCLPDTIQDHSIDVAKVGKEANVSTDAPQ